MNDVDRPRKLFRLAFDPGAADGEAETAAVMLVRHCRARRLTFPEVCDLLSLLVVEQRVVEVQKVVERIVTPPMPGINVVMPFGKHKGRRLGDVWQTHPDYIKWLAGIEGQPLIAAVARRILSVHGVEPKEG